MVVSALCPFWQYVEPQVSLISLGRFFEAPRMLLQVPLRQGFERLARGLPTVPSLFNDWIDSPRYLSPEVVGGHAGVAQRDVGVVPDSRSRILARLRVAKAEGP